MNIGIIGSGWYGSHLALVLKEKGHEVTIYEKGPDIFSNTSAKFGIRLHVGPHYPRSLKTRESCQRSYEQFRSRYSELVIDHEYSIYGLGEFDADNQRSHVDYEKFSAVCHESVTCKEIKPETRGYTNLAGAWDIEEPSIVLGERLREKFRSYLKAANVNIKCHYEVKALQDCNGLVKVIGKDEQICEAYDYVINATSYQALIPNEADFPYQIDIYYQPLLALVYEDTQTSEHPFSLIMMDGLFPCLMPYIDCAEDGKDYKRKYILTHAKWTTMASCKTVSEANNILTALEDNFVEKKIRSACEAEISRFWPDFQERFRYVGWKGSVLAKLMTQKEFRSAVTYAKDNVIHIIPGKVSNIFDAERETLAILSGQNLLQMGDYRYVSGGVLADSMSEITQMPTPTNSRNACTIQTFKKLSQQPNLTPLFFPLASDTKPSKEQSCLTHTRKSSKDMDTITIPAPSL